MRRRVDSKTRVSNRELIQLLEQRCRVHDLESGIRAAQIETRAARTVMGAFEIAASAEAESADFSIHDIPYDAAGGLHEEAFRALVEARRWARRENELAAWASQATTETE